MAAPGTNQALVERAERLRAESRATEHDPEVLALVIFRLGSEIYALPADQVRGVVAKQPIVPIPSTPPHLLGVTHFRGEILPVFDLKVLFGLAATPGAPEYLIIARPGADSAALGCDSCPDIVQVPADEIKAPGSTLGSPVARYLRGNAVGRDGAISVLDVEKVLQC
jgi:purine-binding chemotaxis protein CheW